MEVVPVAAVAASPARAADFLELTKPRITFLVVITSAVGYLVGAGKGVDAATLLPLLFGTLLLAGGASALNQYAERELDGRMHRTRTRPLPSGRVLPAEALAFGLAISAGGLLLLAGCGWLAVALGATALASYTLAYTPLKRVTSLCTVVGAVPGAIPPLIGWAAATGGIDAGGWALFGILFLWQLPHFLAIGWMYREDYARGGFPMLTVLDPDGRSTGRQVVLYSAALVPVTVFAGTVVSAGRAYLWGAIVLGLVFVASALGFAGSKSPGAARRLFLVSILYLPALLAFLVFDR